MYNLVFPDYENSIMNITSSILKYYGVKTEKPSLSILDKELSKKYKNVILFVVDAMGSEILNKHANSAEYLINNKKATLTTVFPSTTVAATTSAITGKAPINSGWIGWVQYFKEEDSNVILFLNKDFYKADKIFNYNISEKFCPIDRIVDVISSQNSKIRTDEIFPEFRTPKHKKFSDLCNSIVHKCNDDEEHFIYAYWDKLDTYLHYTGTESEKVDNHLLEITNNLKKMTDQLGEDSLVIVTADHGQLDIEEVMLWDYKSITDTFTHNPSIEPRATAFFIKEGQHETFVEEFNKNFRESFILYKSEDFIKTHLLGYGNQQNLVKEFLGDYFSVAISNKSFKLINSKKQFKAQHAGLTKDEMLIPLILLNQKK